MLVTGCERRAVHLLLPASPYYRQTLAATPAQIGALFFWFGLFGLIGNVLLTRHIDRFGAARCVGRRAGADHAVAAGLAAGWQLGGHGAGAGALGAGLLLRQLGAAGAPRPHGTGTRAGADGAEHLGHLPRPGHRRGSGGALLAASDYPG